MSKISLIFLLTYAGGILGIFFLDASFGIYLYELEYFLAPKNRWWLSELPNLRYSFIIGISTLIGFILRNKKYSANRLFDIPNFRWLIVFSINVSLVGFIAVWPEAHERIYTTFIKLILFVILLYKLIDTPQKFERMIWAYLIGNFYIGYEAYSTGRSVADRLEGIGPMDSTDSNDIGALLVACIPILIYYFIDGKKIWQKALAAIILAFVLNAIVLVNSRGAFLGLIVSILFQSYYIFFKKLKNTKFKFKMFAGLLCGILLFLYLTDDTFWSRMSTLNDVNEEVVSESGVVVRGGGASRIYFWEKGLDLVQEYPLGVGAWGYQYLSPQFIPKEFLAEGRRTSHSTWIQALTEYGYTGFILFIGFLVSTFLMMMKLRKYLLSRNEYDLFFQNVAITAGFIGFLVACTFIDRLYAETMYWFPAFMACFANIYYIQRHRSIVPKIESIAHETLPVEV